MRKLLGVVLVVGAGGLAAAACDDYPVPPADVSRSGNLQIQKISGDEQTGTPGVQLADPYVVKVVDASGGAVPGVVVQFRITGGGGSLSSSQVVTDSVGNAAVTARLPEQAGATQTVVASSDTAANSVSFTSTATMATAGASDVRIVSGSGQKGITRDTLLDALEVEVTDSEGVAQSDVAVRWTVVSGDGGSLRGSPTRTNDEGIASNVWRLGNEPGAVDSVVAWIEPSAAEPDSVLFTADVTGVPDTIVVTQGAVELDNDYNDPEQVVGDTVFVSPAHWSRKPFKATVLDAAGRTVRGATLSWTVTSGSGAVGDEPEEGDPETVKVFSGSEGGVTVWRRAADAGIPLRCYEELEDRDGFLLLSPCWIGATLSFERYPEVSPVTLDALIRL